MSYWFSKLLCYAMCFLLMLQSLHMALISLYETNNPKHPINSVLVGSGRSESSKFVHLLQHVGGPNLFFFLNTDQSFHKSSVWSQVTSHSTCEWSVTQVFCRQVCCEHANVSVLFLTKFKKEKSCFSWDAVFAAASSEENHSLETSKSATYTHCAFY